MQLPSVVNLNQHQQSGTVIASKQVALSYLDSLNSDTLNGGCSTDREIQRNDFKNAMAGRTKKTDITKFFDAIQLKGRYKSNMHERMAREQINVFEPRIPYDQQYNQQDIKYQ